MRSSIPLTQTRLSQDEPKSQRHEKAGRPTSCLLIWTETTTPYSPKKNRKVKSIQFRYYRPESTKRHLSYLSPRHMESEKELQILSWDDSYGCLIVQELNIALTHQNVSLYQPICCENHLKLRQVWSLRTGAYIYIYIYTHTHIVLSHREECCTC